MSNYTQVTAFTPKDSLASGNPAKVVKGADFDVEFGAISVAIASKTDTSALTAHTVDTANPHSVTKTQVGLGNVDNTSDANKPVSTATQTALNAKQDTLVSGTTIKTVNSASILGAGDLTVQATLVSGTNIKTVNGNSLLGSGDLALGVGTGDVTGPASSTDNTLPRYDGTTGKLLQGSGVTVDDSGNMVVPGTLTATGGVVGSASTPDFIIQSQGII